MLVGKQDRINHTVGPLSRLDGGLQGFLAASVISVGKNDKGLAALLLFHQFIGSEVDGIVQQGAAAPVHSRQAIPRTRRLRAGGSGVIAVSIAIRLWTAQQLKPSLQFFTRRS